MRTLFLSAPLALVACTGAGPGSVYGDDLLPTEEQIRINLPTEGAAKDTHGGTDFAEYYVVTRNVTEHVNGLVAFVLGTVAYVTTLEPSWSDTEENTAIWGPYKDSGLDPVETGVWVRAEDDGTYTWAVFQVPNGGTVEEDAIPVVAGVVDEGSTREAASGVFAVDFDTASALDPAVGLVGAFYVEYDYDADGVRGVAGFEQYGAEAGEHFDAVYAYDEDYAGAGEMDLAWLDDVDGAGSDEIASLRSRWTADGAGRGDARVLGGDLGSVEVTASQCWGTDFQTSYYADSHDISPAEGDVSACAFADAEYPTEASFQIVE
ncbi:MAG: hypothetical protein ACOZNI_18030 [Myxococcota bacterium]